MTVSVSNSAFEIGAGGSVGCRNDVNDTATFTSLLPGIEVSELKPPSGYRFELAMLPDLLQLGRIDLQLVAITERNHELIHVGRRPGARIAADNPLRRICHTQGILKSSRQEQSVARRAPFVVPAGEEERFLRFLDTQPGIRIILTIELPQISAIGSIIDGLEVGAIVRCYSLLQLERDGQLIQIVVQPIAIKRAIEDLRGVGHVVVDTVLRGSLCPITPALIFRARNQAHAVALEKARVFLLRHRLRERARLRRGEKICQKIFT